MALAKRAAYTSSNLQAACEEAPPFIQRLEYTSFDGRAFGGRTGAELRHRAEHRHGTDDWDRRSGVNCGILASVDSGAQSVRHRDSWCGPGWVGDRARALASHTQSASHRSGK